MIRPRTGYAFADIEDCFAGAGKQAIDAFYMRGIYVSGMIFNRHIITDQIIRMNALCTTNLQKTGDLWEM